MRRLLLPLLGLLCVAPVWAGQLLPNGQQYFSGQNGAPLSLGFVYTYAPGTTTQKTTWQDPQLSVPNTNPIVLDANGQARIWSAGTYRQVVMDSIGNLIYDAVTQTPGSVNGPATTVVGHLATWNSIDGTLLGGDPQIAVNVNDLDLQPGGLTALSSLNSNYFSSFSQETAVRLKLSLSGSVSDTQGSFRDGLYVELDDSDTSFYVFEHVDYAGRFAAFGPQTTVGVWQSFDKNLVALNAYAKAATSSVPQPTFPPGVSAFNGDAFQYGGGIGDNEFAAHQPAASDGSIAFATSLAALQGIIDSNYDDSDDSTHTSYAFLASNIGTKAITAMYGASGSGVNHYFIQAGGVTVSKAAIVMPHSATTTEGSIIDYGKWNGNPAGGSYSWWSPSINGGQFGWTDAGNQIGHLDTAGLDLALSGSLGTGATGPFIYLSEVGGTPTAVPTKESAGNVGVTWDNVHKKLCVYDRASVGWLCVVLS